MRTLILAFVLGLGAAACTSEEEPVANRFDRSAAEIENRAKALEAEVENQVGAVEAEAQNEIDAFDKQANLTAPADAEPDANAQ